MAADPPVREFAPAKINLYLHVTGKREDGYHELDSLVVFADAGDRLEAVTADDISLGYAGTFAGELPDPDTNLALRAAQLLADAFGVSSGAAMTLTKNLPVASGIGGGSADAAAAIRAMIRLWGLDPDDGRISKIALSLGADVPVCLMNRPTVMRGIGEDLQLVGTFPALPVVLVNPGIGVSTPAVFKARSGGFSSPVTWPPTATTPDEVIESLRQTHNDLQVPAEGIAPVISDVLRVLENRSGVHLARMSGSGATCFAVFGTELDAHAAAHEISAALPDWWVHAGATYGT